jgi:hypothetical protein
MKQQTKAKLDKERDRKAKAQQKREKRLERRRAKGQHLKHGGDRRSKDFQARSHEPQA